ncbi:elastin [Hyalangium rubrum]|uniref:Elastin n=1 Tax=Hyalangium rubrum TaxID=3103134 RepID=A0ABU5GVP8_9BACT|nr:elastin [Hyalangium sp. s54d21]MDY7225245.1 elastin [Hyalangium sp. s54d21]
MAGSLVSVVVAGLLAAPAAGDFAFEGREASARTRSSVGFFAQGTVPYPNQYERGVGSATLTAEDRLVAPGATYGDKARLDARFRLGASEYQVELTQAGFPPTEASGTAPASQLPRPGHSVEGGVILDRELNGFSGLGWPAATQVHAAVAVWGVGRVLLNGQVITDSAVIHVSALSHGAQADDDTHLPLPQARAGDTELQVLVWNLPLSVEPRGFIQFSFDDVEISLADQPVKAVASVPSEQLEAVDARRTASVGGAITGGTPLSPPARPGDAVGGSGFDASAPAVTGLPGGPVTPVSPGLLSGPASPDPLVVPGVVLRPTEPLAGTVTTGTPGVSNTTIAGAVGSSVTVGPGAVTPDTISGTFPTIGAPTPAANISGLMPGTPAPGSVQAEQTPIPPGAPPPGGPAEAGVALGTSVPRVSAQGSFSVVPISPPNFSAFAGTPQMSPGLIATVPPLGSDPTTPTSALLGSPAPLTAAPAPPLLGTPAPLNAAPAPALIGTPAPVNATPGATTATPVAPSAGVPAGTAVTPPGSAGVPPSI